MDQSNDLEIDEEHIRSSGATRKSHKSINQTHDENDNNDQMGK